MNKLNGNEVSIIKSALGETIESIQSANQNIDYAFTPAARKRMNKMLSIAQSALAKIVQASGKEILLEPSKPGDEREFLTRES